MSTAAGEVQAGQREAHGSTTSDTPWLDLKDPRPGTFRSAEKTCRMCRQQRRKKID